MNQEMVKERLQLLYKEKVPYSVIFSGKGSKRINGLYKLDTQEILIHNKNFSEGDTVNENLLMYTAIHELAHHIHTTEYHHKGARSHTQEFWAIFHDLIDAAEKAGIYHLDIDEETQGLISEVCQISREIAALQRKLGEVLDRLHETCTAKGYRFEDVAERKAQISRGTRSMAIAANALDLPGDIGIDIQQEVIRKRDKEKRAAIIEASREGKTIAQIKATPPVPNVNKKEDEETALIKEKDRIERSISSLKRRYENICKQLETLGIPIEESA